ncbi:MAG TPA: RecQ family ATP-dependent DNA helicase [Pyrinomonadaceae bacterium]|nr:RecQ family ATP-dependent DNA helicase [Pyrinomonadaceae bacterium]
MATIDDALVSLRKHFGFDAFREGQTEVISAILEGKNAVVVMPTGSGKSLCYQLPAMMLKGATLVVSPLIALMKDQVDALLARGLPATFINSSISATEQHQRIDALRRGEYKLVYVAPERFRSERFVSALLHVGISLFAVDEAHCVSTWGHDFRPDYLKLRSAIHALGDVQTLALTATATPYVRSDIIQQLGLQNPPAFVSGFDRPNLSIEVIHTEKEREKIAHIKRLALTHQGSGIIYASTRKAVEQVAASLQVEGLRVAAYHAGMGDAVRLKAQEDFMEGRTQMIVATNAFGMGIDKAEIRFVAHYHMPGSIEAYYQEIGRAGRDGLPSECVLLFNYADKNTHDFFIEGSYPELATIQSVYDVVISMGSRRIELSTKEISKRAGINNEMAVNSALYLLERAGHIDRVAPADLMKRGRDVIVLDKAPMKLRVTPAEVSGRAALERRKLREILNFCYSDYCFRAHILDYFGDRHHARQCGTCGNCAPRSYAGSLPLLNERQGMALKQSGKQRKRGRTFIVPRALTENETLRIRKILACATRMKGRFGKHVLAATLRGSAAQNVLKAHLNELSTYGLLRDMKQDEILLYIDALIVANCLRVTPGEYPMVVITPFGEGVMREQERVELALPVTDEPEQAEPVTIRGTGDLSATVMETYSLYRQGISVTDIAARRECTLRTIEGHLADCVRAGLEVDVSQFVASDERSQIEKAIALHGIDKLKPIREALPESITYPMIRFVIADLQRAEKVTR